MSSRTAPRPRSAPPAFSASERTGFRMAATRTDTAGVTLADKGSVGCHVATPPRQPTWRRGRIAVARRSLRRSPLIRVTRSHKHIARQSVASCPRGSQLCSRRQQGPPDECATARGEDSRLDNCNDHIPYEAAALRSPGARRPAGPRPTRGRKTPTAASAAAPGGARPGRRSPGWRRSPLQRPAPPRLGV
jgi:hypothetical protein